MCFHALEYALLGFQLVSYEIVVTYELFHGPHPAFRRLQYGKIGERPRIIYHVSDVKVERRVERT